MKNLSVWSILCMICTTCFCAPSLRASSIPLNNYQPTLAVQKTTTAAVVPASDSTETPTEETTTTNEARLAFVSPIKHNPYYIQPTTNPNNNTSGNAGTSAGTNNTQVAADIAAIQHQIDELLEQQQQMADSVRTTVQTEIKNSDLTQNASFNEAVSNLQESVAPLTNVDDVVDEQLVKKGILDNRGRLLVATTEEIQPLALSQKLDSTLSTKFAKKTDIAPAKLAADIATNDAAVQTLAQRVGTTENTIKSVIATDLKQRGIIDSNNSLNVAKKSELPVINTETVAEALQNSTEFDNMISQNLVNKGIYDSNKQLQVLKKSELTPELLTTKLDTIYTKPSDITPEKLSTKLNNVFVTPTELNNKNYATKSELPVINEASVSAALENSTALDNSVIKNLKGMNILNSNGTLNVATKDELQTQELQQQIDTLRNTQSNLAQSQITMNDVTTTIQSMDLPATNNTLSRALSDIRTSNQALQSSVDAVQQQANSISTNLNSNIDSKLRERGLMDNNNTALFATKSETTADAIAQSIADSATAKAKLSGQIGPNTDTVNNLITQKLKDKGLVTNDANATRNVLTTNDLTKQLLSNKLDNAFVTPTELNNKGYITTEALSGYATTDALDPTTIAQNIANITTAKAKLSGQINPNADTVNNLITQKLKDKGLVTNDANATRKVLTSDELNTTLASKNYATKEELPTINEETVSAALANSTTLDNTVIKTLKNKGILDNNTAELNVATKTELAGLNDTFALKNEVGTSESKVDELITTKLKAKGLITNDTNANRAVLTNDELETALASKNYASTSALNPVTIAQSIADSTAAKAKLAGQIGTSESDVKNILVAKGLLKNDENNTLNVATKTELAGLNDTFALKNEVGTSESKVDELITSKLKAKGLVTNDTNATRNVLTSADLDNALATKDYATKSELPTVDEKTVSAALANSTTLNNTVIQTLKNKGVLNQDTDELNVATKTELAGLNNTFALKSEVGTSESKVDELITSKLKAKGLVTNDANADRAVLTNNDLTTALSGYATTDALNPVTIAQSIADSSAAKAELAGKLGTSESDVKTILVNKGLLKDDENNSLNVATKTELAGLNDTFALKNEVGTSESKVNELITTKLKGKGIISNDSNETLQLATTAQLNALDTAVTNLDGDISNPNSLLYKIKHNTSIQEDLKGKDGTSVSVSDVTSALKSDQNFLDSVKGKDGTGYTLKGSVETYNDLPQTNNTQGDGWYVEQTGLLYVYSCDSNGENCAYPIVSKGLPFKGEKGTSFNYSGECGWSSTIPSCLKAQEGNACAHTDGKLYICSCNGTNCEYKGTQLKGADGISPKSVEQQYCEDNLAIVQKLYPNNNISSAADCANTTKFSNTEYSAIMGGAKAYCLSLTKDLVAGKVSFTSGIGKKLADTLGSGSSTKLTSFKNQSIATVLDKSTSTYKFGDKNFIEACEDNYNEIMSGKDGEDAATPWFTYCSENNNYNLTNIITPLYSNITNCNQFTNTEYTAILGGAKAYCLSLTKDLVAGKVSFASGIGKKLADTLDNGDTTKLNSFKNKSMATVLDSNSNTYKFGNKNFVDACEEKYNDIMAGAKGEDGVAGDSAAETWCKAHSAQYTDKKTNQIKTISAPTALTASKGLTAFNALKTKKGLNNTQIAEKIDTTTRVFASVEDCVAAVEADPSIMEGKSEADKEFDENNSTITLTDTNLTGLNTFRSNFKNTLKGKTASDAWCEANFNKDFSFAKSTRVKAIAGNKLTTNSTTGIGKFATVQDCKDAMNADESLFTEVLKGESASDQAVNEEFVKADDKSAVISKYNTVTKLSNWATDGFKASLKGETGTGITYRGSVPTYEDLPATSTVQQGDAYYNEEDGKMYTATCTNNSCTFPAKGEGNQYRGEKGRDGTTYIPEVNAATGMLKWKNESGSYYDIAEVKVKGEDGDTFTPTYNNGRLVIKNKAGTTIVNEQVKGEDGITYEPNVSAAGILTWKNSKTQVDSGITGVNIKGEKGDNGATFTPTFDSSTGKLSWASDKAGVTLPSEMKIAKTDTELGSLVADKISADTTLAKKTDLTAEKLGATLGNTFAGKSSFETLSGTVGGLSTTVTKLDGADTVEGSIANKIKVAKTTIESGIDNKLTGYATTGTVTDLTTRTASLESNALTTGNLADKLSASNSTVKKAFSDAGFAKTDDITAEKLSATLSNTFATKGTVDSLSGTITTLTGGENDAGSIANKIKTAKATIESGIDNKLTGYATTGTVTDLTTRTASLESNALTADNLTDKLSGENNAVKQALTNAGFAQSSEIATTIDNTLNGTGEGSFANRLSNAGVITTGNAAQSLQNTFASKGSVDTLLGDANTTGSIANRIASTLDGDANTTGSFANRMANAGVITDTNIAAKVSANLPDTVVQSNNLPSNIVTTGNLSDSTVKNALTNAGFAQTNDVVTKNNLATELSTNSAQAALANAGFATKSNITNEVKDEVFTLADFSQLLSSGGLEVDSQGKLKLADTTQNSAAANITTKLNAAKATNQSIQTVGLTATSNITTSIAGVAASAAGDEIKTEEACIKKEYMFWNGSKCEKCPDGTYFDKSASTRCVCKDSALTFSGGTCIKASMTSDKCTGQNGAGMYFSTKSNTCEKCPSGTYFNEASMNDVTQPRCICEDKSLEFSASTGTCTKASSCAITKTVANSKNECQACPKEFPFTQYKNGTGGTCSCPTGSGFNIYRWSCASCEAAGAGYNAETLSCTCPTGMTLDQEQWHCL